MAWFKQKRYGLGASPSSWQGWALTAVYVLGMIAAAITLISETETLPVRFIAIAVVLTILFVGIAWRTTEGGWRWRWGDKD